MSKSRSLAIVTAAYAVAFAVAAAWLGWGPTTGRLWLDTLVADRPGDRCGLRLQPRLSRNSSFYDAYWSVDATGPDLVYWWSQAGPGCRPTCAAGWLAIVDRAVGRCA
jgi:hypothetical protein